MEWYPAHGPLGYALAPDPGTRCFVSCSVCVCVCLFVCLSECIEIWYLFHLLWAICWLSRCCVAVFCVCWDGLKGGGRPGKVGIEERERSRGRNGSFLLPRRRWAPALSGVCICAYTKSTFARASCAFAHTANRCGLAQKGEGFL